MVNGNPHTLYETQKQKLLFDSYIIEKNLIEDKIENRIYFKKCEDKELENYLCLDFKDATLKRSSIEKNDNNVIQLFLFKCVN